MGARIVVGAAIFLAACGRFGFDPFGSNGSTDAPAPGDGRGPDGGSGAIQIVQKSDFRAVLGNSTTITFHAPQAAGDTIIVYAWSWNAVSTSFPGGAVTDERGDVYAEAISINTGMSCGGGQGAAAIYYTKDIPASSAALTLTITPAGGTAQEIGVVAIEYAGLDPTLPLDRVASRETAQAASPFVFDSGTTSITSTANELIAAVANECAGAPNDVTWADGAGFTIEAEQTATNNLQPGLAADKIVAAVSAYVDNWTVTFTGLSPGPGIGVIATFR